MAESELEQADERAGGRLVAGNLGAEDQIGELRECEEDDEEGEAEADEVLGRVAQRHGQHADLFVEAQELEELERGAEDHHGRDDRVVLVPEADRVEVDKFAHLALVHGLHRHVGEHCAHAEHHDRDEREDNYDHLVDVPELGEVAHALLLDLERLGDDEVDEKHDEYDLEHEHGDAVAAQVAVQLTHVNALIVHSGARRQELDDERASREQVHVRIVERELEEDRTRQLIHPVVFLITIEYKCK